MLHAKAESRTFIQYTILSKSKVMKYSEVFTFK